MLVRPTTGTLRVGTCGWLAAGQLAGFMIGGSVGWCVGQVVDELVGLLLGWLAGWLDWFVGPLGLLFAGLSVDRSVRSPVSWLFVCWLIGWLAVRLVGWLDCLQAGWLVVWNILRA